MAEAAALPQALAAWQPPRLVRVRQRFPRGGITDPAAAVRDALAAPGTLDALRPGMRIGIAVGSRGIAGLAAIVRTLVAALRARGTDPCIIPAMGSHGGATAAGQTALLAGYGVSAHAMGAPVVSAMDAPVVSWLRFDAAAQDYMPASEAPDAVPVRLAADALACDAVVAVARIKPHTGFRGPIESGICKMLAVGLGKHQGAAALHREGYGRFARLIPAAARAVLATGRIAWSLAIVEDGEERLDLVEAVPAAATLSREPELLRRARGLLPRLLVPRCDVLVVERIGKDISGIGMDSNVTGRGESGPLAGHAGPRIGRIVVLRLSGAGGNASGIGYADVVTEAAVSAIDWQATRTNALTSGSLGAARLPLVMPDERTAIAAALAGIPGITPDEAAIVRIRDTMHLGEIAVSPALARDLATTDACEIDGPFDGSWARRA